MSRPERYNAYFQALIDEMREQHNWTRARRPSGSNYCHFPSDCRDIYYSARFPKGETVHTYLLIDFTDYERNKNFFDILKEKESEINARFNMPLCWDRRGDRKIPRRKRCRIYIERGGSGGNIESDESKLEAFRAWHVENLRKFKEVFTPEIKLALEKLKSSEIELE